MPPKRMTANPTAPLRYRAGKPLPANDQDSSSSSESEDDSDAEPKQPPSRAPPPKAASFPKITTDLAARQKAAAEARAKELAAQASRQGDDEGFVTASSSEDDEAGSGSGSEDEDSDDEDDYDSDSSAGKPKFVAPTFISKSKRTTTAAGKPPDPAAVEADREAEAERLRQAKADELLQSQIERAAREKAEGRRDWDDEDGAVLEDVDDTDGVDPEVEHAAWRLRELKRVKREREAIEEAEREREEVERRRGLTAEEREKEDREWIEKQKEEREGRGKMGFMQKYFHRGAFFQEDGDDEAVDEAKRRDVMGAKFADDAANREILPQYMQIRDMTKLGKKGRTRYRDLKSEDTGRFGADLKPGRGRGDAGGRYEGPSGANGVAVGERRRRDDDRDGREEKRPRHER